MNFRDTFKDCLRLFKDTGCLKEIYNDARQRKERQGARQVFWNIGSRRSRVFPLTVQVILFFQSYGGTLVVTQEVYERYRAGSN